MASAGAPAYMRVWGRSPQRGPGAEPNLNLQFISIIDTLLANAVGVVSDVLIPCSIHRWFWSSTLA